MKTLMTLLFTLVLGTGIVQAAAFEKTAKYKTTKIAITAEKPLVAGSNVLQFSITQKGEVPSGAKVTVKAFMPAMPGMPYMESKIDAKGLGNGKYEAEVNFSMGGTWQMHIFIIPAEGKKTRVKTSVNI